VPKTSLVAGGAGFIGSHLCEALLKRGHRVLALDSLISGRRANLQSPVYSRYKKNFRFIKKDILGPLDFRADYIFNLASPASPPHYQTHSIYTLRTGSEGTYNLLKLAKKNNARFLHASTSEVYGDPQVHPQPETYWGHVNPIGVRACYDEAKRYAEALIMEFWRKEGLDTRIVRIFNTYGPRLDPDDGRVISNYIKQALQGKDLTIYGSGKQTRSFQYVSDLVDAMQVVMFSPKAKAGCFYNTGNPHEFTMLEAARLVKKLTGADVALIHKPLPKDDPTRRKPDIRKIKRELGWQPKVKFAVGLKKTIAWYRANELNL
jgi:nucleoside-diphosphate-sugar epimerase